MLRDEQAHSGRRRSPALPAQGSRYGDRKHHIRITIDRKTYEHDVIIRRTRLEGGDDAAHEAEEPDTTAALGMRGNDPAGGDFERCEQGRGAVPFVIMALAGQGASVR